MEKVLWDFTLITKGTLVRQDGMVLEIVGTTVDALASMSERSTKVPLGRKKVQEVYPVFKAGCKYRVGRVSTHHKRL